jgi:phospholipid/cholesterol/gamma-HCH transport system substrate-binding protein
MQSENKSSNLKLGIFVIAGSLILIATLFYMGQERNMFGSTLPVSVVFTDVQGLQVGNSVQFMGTNVGTVKKITILSPTAIQVDMVIEEEISRFIKVDATAQIATEGLMGNKIVSIKTTSSEAAAIQAGSLLQSHSTVAIDSLFNSLQLTSTQVLKLAQNLTAITDQMRQGEGVVGSLLTDTIMASRLAGTIAHLHQSSIQTNLLMSKLSHMATRVNDGQGAIGMLLSDTLVNKDLKEAIGHIRLISRQSAQLSGELLNASRQLNTGEGMAHTLLRDTVFSNNIEQSLLEIREGSKKFNQNMEALQHNFLLRKFFRKKKASQGK